MKRRRVLVALGGGVGSAGCLEVGPETATPTDRSDPSTTRSSTPTDTPASPATESPTETPRCLGQTDQRLPIGASVRYDDWVLTVTSVELTRTYRLDGESTTRTLPDGKQFVIVTVDAVNRADERRLWTDDSGFRLIGPGCTTVDWDTEFPTEENPEFGRTVSKIRRIEHIKQFQYQVYYPFDPGQEGRMWYLAVTTASYDRSELEIGSDFTPRRPGTRWVPTLGTDSS